MTEKSGRARRKPAGDAGDSATESPPAEPTPSAGSEPAQVKNKRAGRPKVKAKPAASKAKPAASKAKPAASKAKPAASKAKPAGEATAKSSKRKDPGRPKTRAKSPSGARSARKKVTVADKRHATAEQAGQGRDPSAGIESAEVKDFPDSPGATEPTTDAFSSIPGAGSDPQKHLEAIQPMAEQLKEPQSFRDLVSHSIENQPSLGWEKKLLAKWAQRKRK